MIIPSKFGQNPYNKENAIRQKDGQRKRMVTDHNNSGEVTSGPLEGASFDPRAVIWISIEVY